MEPLFDSLRRPDGFTVAYLIAIQLAVALFVIWIVKLLWNSTLPGLFEFKRLSYWQAIKISLLVWILVGGPPALKLSMG